MLDTYLIKYQNRHRKILITCTNKCGSSSLITMLGYPFIGEFRYRKDIKKIPHNLWEEVRIQHLTTRAQKHLLNEWPNRVAILRDPVERFISCYKDRVLQLNKDNTQSYVPNFEYFVENIEEIKNKSRDIRKHLTPFTHSYAPPEDYTHIFLTKDLNEKVKPLIEELSGVKNIPIVQHKNSSKAPAVIPTENQIEKIKQMYKEDYTIYGKYFT